MRGFPNIVALTDFLYRGHMALRTSKENAGTATALVAAHEQRDNPHGQYLKADTVGVTVAGLDAQGKVPSANLPIIGGGSDPWTFTALANDAANSTITLADAPGMNFLAVLGTYIVEAWLPFQSAATTTGIAVALDVPPGSLVYGLGHHATTATTLGSSEQIADNATTGATTGVRAVNTPTLYRASWLVFATAGAVQLRFRSEVAASAVTLKAGGILGRRTV